MNTMAPGPYEICHVTLNEGTDCNTYRSLSWGYDRAADAYRALPGIAQEAGVPEADCCVIRFIDMEEASQFNE